MSETRHSDNQYIKDKKSYLKEFEGRVLAGEKRNKALEHALDIRKFEIDLYWKRATYFWGFLIVTFAGYFTVLAAEVEKMGTSEKLMALLLISLLGLAFSFSWFLVNKGSKFWQNNWERHVDMLEDEVVGPLYKAVLVRGDTIRVKEREIKRNFKKSASNKNIPSLVRNGLKLITFPLCNTKNIVIRPSEYSVSNINQLLSFYIFKVWLILSILNLVKVMNNYILTNFGVLIGVNGDLIDKSIDKLINAPFEELIFFFLTFKFMYDLFRLSKSSHVKEKDFHVSKYDYFFVRKRPLDKDEE